MRVLNTHIEKIALNDVEKKPLLYKQEGRETQLTNLRYWYTVQR